MIRRILEIFKASRDRQSSVPEMSRLESEAAAAMADGDIEPAIRLYSRLIALDPNRSEVYYRRGNALNGAGRLEAALADFVRTTSLDPGHGRAFCNRGVVLERLGRYEEALSSYDRAAQLDPADFVVHYNRGTVLRQLGRPHEAIRSYDIALNLKDDYVEAWINLGGVQYELGRFGPALESYDTAIRSAADGPFGYLAWYRRGFVLADLGRLEEALGSFERAITLKDDSMEAHINRANVLQGLHRHEEAVASYDRALVLGAGVLSAHLAYYRRGLALIELRMYQEALTSFERSLEIKRDFADAHAARGNVLQELRRHEEAVGSYDEAIELKPDRTVAHAAYFGRGFALKELRRFEEALASFDQALMRNEQDVEAYMHRGGVLQELRRHEAAVESYKTASKLDPCRADAFQGLGFSYLKLQKREAAIASFNRALSIEPDRDYLLGFRRHVQMQICDWDGFQADMVRLKEGLEAGASVAPPFQVLALLDSGRLHRAAAEIWVRKECPADETLGPVATSRKDGKIRIGYFSADFRNHPVSLLTVGVFESHDRSRFEIVAFAFGPEADDPMVDRLKLAFDRFIDVRGLTDVDVARLSRSLDIDVAVDLGGFTEECRTKIFAMRAAPLQVSYIGYLGTMGAPYVDYLLADKAIVPTSHQENYSEKIIYLPSYQANDPRRRTSERILTREHLGLPDGNFVFACFNASYKITPPTFSMWMRILQRVEESSLFLYVNNSAAEQNLRRAAERSGVDSCRLVFGGHLAADEYLARYRAMDLFLDTLPYNAGTTASDALWAGLPVLTCLGQAFSGRVAASLLTAVGLPELIAESPARYEELAVMLATDRESLTRIRNELELNRLTAPLFNIDVFTRNLESVYLEICARQRAGLPTAHIRNEA